MVDFYCPKCKQKLVMDKGCCKCPEGHSYDVAREGYVNLLLADKKNSKNPGDNKQMVRARAEFLEKGNYAFMAEEVAALVKKLAGGSPVTLLDAGCGTGYYLKKVLDANPNARVAAVDISKEAVKACAKYEKRASCAVASVYDLPFAADTFDIITCIFSPYAYKEYARVLKPGGALILVYPAPSHLMEIKRALYGENAYENEKSPQSEYLQPPAIKTVERAFTADKNDLSALIAMTPYFYKTSAEAIDKLKSVATMTVTASFEIAVFKK